VPAFDLSAAIPYPLPSAQATLLDFSEPMLQATRKPPANSPQASFRISLPRPLPETTRLSRT
jgi:hypothetical protein